MQNKYPKTHGKVNNHSGSNLFARTLKVIDHYYGVRYLDTRRFERLLKRLPQVWERCRSNEGY